MPEIKKTFTGAKMNKDADERLVQSGEYRDALNIQIRTSDGSGDTGLGDAGTVQNIKGNAPKLSFYETESYIADKPGPIVIGESPDKTRIIGNVGDESNDKAYFFAAAPVPVGGLLGGNLTNNIIKTASLGSDGKWEDGKSERIWIDSIQELDLNGGNKYILVDRFAVTSVLEDVADFSVFSPGTGYVYITVDDATKYRIGMRVYAQDIPDDDGEVTNYLWLNEEQTIPGAEIVNIDGNNLIFSTKQTSNLSTIAATLFEDGTKDPNGVIYFIHPERVLEFDYWKGNNSTEERAYNIITGINILDNLLYWTDGKHEPKRINIDRCRAGTQNSGFASDGTIHTKLHVNNPITGELEEVSPNDGGGIENLLTSDIKRENVTVIRKSPKTPPTLHLSTNDRNGDTSGSYIGNFVNSDAVPPYPSEGDSRIVILTGIEVRLDDVIKFTHNSVYFDDPAIVRGKVTNVDENGINITIKLLSISDEVLEFDPSNWEFEIEQRKPLFETKFGRFAYRYQYEDNEFSSFSPFSELAFLPGSFEYTSSKGYNKGMVNNVRSLTIKNFIPDNNIRPMDVKSVDILWKPTDDANVYVVKTIRREIDLEWENFAFVPSDTYSYDNTGSFVVTTEMIHKVLPSNQLLRAWDNVPKFAISQEMTANRIVYGNYTQGYDLNIPVGIKQSLESERVVFPNPQKSVKSIRNYQFGAVFGDKYGRETSVITNGYKQTLIDDQEIITETVSGDLVVEKSLAGYKNKFKLKQSWEEIQAIPPSWMNYVKFYVKETSNEYYNLVLDRWYDAEDNNIWLSFPSADRNKIDEESYLILKNGHGTQKPITEEARYKVIAIENDAPDYIKTVNRDYDMIHMLKESVYDGDVSDGRPTALFGGPEETNDPNADYRKVLCTTSNWNSVDPEGKDFKGTAKARIIGYFISSSENNKKYYAFSPWKNITKLVNKDDEKGVVFREMFDEVEVNMYQKILAKLLYPTDLSGAVSNLENNYSTGGTNNIGYYLQLRDAVAENKPEFDGRFFAKIEKDEVLKTNVLGTKVSYEVQNTYRVGYIAAAKWNRAMTAEDVDDPDNFIAGAYNTSATNTWPGEVFTADEVRFNYGYNDELADGLTPTNFDGNVTVLTANTDDNGVVNTNLTLDNAGSNGTNEDDQVVPMFGPGNPDKTRLFWEWWKGNDPDTNLPRRSTNIFIDHAPAYRGFSKLFNFPQVGGGSIQRQILQYLGSGFQPLSHHLNTVTYGPYPAGATYPDQPYDLEVDQNWQPSGLNIGDALGGQYGQLTFSVIGVDEDWEPEEGIEGNPAGQIDSLFKSAMTTPGTLFSFANDPNGETYKVVSFNQDNFDGNEPFSPPIEITSDNHSDIDAVDTHKRQTIITRFSRVNPNGDTLPGSGIDISAWDPRGEARHDGIGYMEIQILGEVASSDLSEDGVATNAACWETEPKEDVGLDIYYEASEAIPVKLKQSGDLITFTKPSNNKDRASKISIKTREVELTPADDIENLATEQVSIVGDPRVFRSIGNNAIALVHDNPILTELVTSISNGASAVGVAINDEISFKHHDGTVTRSKILDHYALASGTPGDVDVAVPSDRTTRTLSRINNQLGSFLYGTGADDDINGNSIIGAEVIGPSVPVGTFVVGAVGNANSDPSIIWPSGLGSEIIKLNKQVGGDSYEFRIVTGFFKIDTDVWKYPVDLGWFNCYSFGNGVESDRIRDDFNAPQIDNGVKVSSTILEYGEETKGSGLIYSGLYNSTSSVNDLSQFNMAEKITKDLNPIYGSIQAMKTGEGILTVFAEDKVIKVLANRNALYNADGNAQLTSTNTVLGTATPYSGDFGISKNPESLASDQFRMYFADKQRGAVLRLSMDGLTPISDVGMRVYFREKLKDCDNIVGSFDAVTGEYNITLNTAAKFTEGGTIDNKTTVSFNEQSKGWVSFKSFTPSSGLSITGKYFTAHNNKAYLHYDNNFRNNFYGTAYNSEIEVLFNDQPGSVKSFKAINYEGSQAKINQFTTQTLNGVSYTDGEYYNLSAKTGWYVDSFNTDLQEGKVPEFIDKENKWFNKITGLATTLDNLDVSEFSVQGIGFPLAVISTEPDQTQLSISDLGDDD